MTAWIHYKVACVTRWWSVRPVCELSGVRFPAASYRRQTITLITSSLGAQHYEDKTMHHSDITFAYDVMLKCEQF